MNRRRWGRTIYLATATLVAVLAALPVGVQAQTPSSSPQPSPPAGPGVIGATTEVARDPFDQPGTWQVLDDQAGRTAVEDGRLLISVTDDGSSYWDSLALDAPWPVVRVSVKLAMVEGAGGAGPACSSALGLPRAFVAGITNDDAWWLGRLIDGRLQVIKRGLLPLGSSASSAIVAIECASVPSKGGDHIVMSVDGRVVTSAFDIPVGPYDKATLLVASDVGPVTATFDDLVVHAGPVYVPTARNPDAPSE
jgi:hypothetical protein